MTRINQYNRNIKNKFRLKNTIREIYYYQKKTKLLIPKKSFERLIQEIIQNIQGNYLKEVLPIMNSYCFIHIFSRF